MSFILDWLAQFDPGRNRDLKPTFYFQLLKVEFRVHLAQVRLALNQLHPNLPNISRIQQFQQCLSFILLGLVVIKNYLQVFKLFFQSRNLIKLVLNRDFVLLVIKLQVLNHQCF